MSDDESNEMPNETAEPASAGETGDSPAGSDATDTSTEGSDPESHDEVEREEPALAVTAGELAAAVATNARTWGTLTVSYAARDVVFEDIPGNTAMQILTALRHPHIELEDPLGLFAPAEARWMLVDRRIMGADWRPGNRRYPPTPRPVDPALAAFDPPAEPIKTGGQL